MDNLTLLGKEIKTETRGILYLCDLTETKLNVCVEIQFNSAFEALECYANIPNPESQLVTGRTYEDLIAKNEDLRNRINTPQFIEELHDCI
jgi:hypothetical protein